MGKSKPGSSKAVRVNNETYKRLRALQMQWNESKGMKLTLSQFLDEIEAMGQLLLQGYNVYEVDSSIYHDQAEAWGAAIRLSVMRGEPCKPLVYLCMGEDDAHEFPKSGAV